MVFAIWWFRCPALAVCSTGDNFKLPAGLLTSDNYRGQPIHRTQTSEAGTVDFIGTLPGPIMKYEMEWRQMSDAQYEAEVAAEQASAEAVYEEYDEITNYSTSLSGTTWPPKNSRSLEIQRSAEQE